MWRNPKTLPNDSQIEFSKVSRDEINTQRPSCTSTDSEEHGDAETKDTAPSPVAQDTEHAHAHQTKHAPNPANHTALVKEI